MWRKISIFLGILLILFTGKGFSFCTVNVSEISFSEYNPLSAFPVDYSGTIEIYCKKTSNVTVSIGPSPNSGFNPRKMTNAESGETLNYNLYTNANRTLIWGDGSQGTSTMRVNVKKNSTEYLTVYGRVFAGQDVGIGTYTDNLIVSISY